MSDDGLAFDGGNIFLEDEEEPAVETQGEGQNKTFIIAVGILGGLLVCAIGAFLVWAIILNPRMQARNQLPTDVVPTNTPTVEVAIPEEDTPTPPAPATNTPAPTASPTPVVGPTATPKPDDGSAAASTTQTPQPSPTPQRATATPTKAPAAAARTPTPSATRTSYATTDRTPPAGLGEVALVVAAGVLLAILFFARRLRHA